MASVFENEIIEKRIPLAGPVRKKGAAGKRSDFGFTCFLKYERECEQKLAFAAGQRKYGQYRKAYT